MTPLKQAIEAYITIPADDTSRRAELFEAIEQHIYAEFEAEADMTEERLGQIDVTEMAHRMIERADY